MGECAGDFRLILRSPSRLNLRSLASSPPRVHRAGQWAVRVASYETIAKLAEGTEAGLAVLTAENASCLHLLLYEQRPEVGRRGLGGRAVVRAGLPAHFWDRWGGGGMARRCWPVW